MGTSTDGILTREKGINIGDRNKGDFDFETKSKTVSSRNKQNNTSA